MASRKTNIIGLKELRENTEYYIREVAKGKSFEIVRRSKPIFTVVPAGAGWDHYVDLTKYRPGGVAVEEMIERLENIERLHRSHGRNRQTARKSRGTG